MENFSNNFRNGSNDIDCCLCLWQEGLQFIDSQQHFINNCKVVSDKFPEINNINEKDIYSTKNANVKSVKILTKAVKTRKTLLLNFI